MKQIGVPPGAFKFRLVLIVILVTIFTLVFLDYSSRLSVVTEKASIRQVINIVNSTLVVVFSTYAMKGELSKLNELNGSNPFIHLGEYNLQPVNYLGEIEAGNWDDVIPGWYFDTQLQKVVYKTYYDDAVYYFSVILNYRDVDGSGRFESDIDEYQHLYFKQCTSAAINHC